MIDYRDLEVRGGMLVRLGAAITTTSFASSYTFTGLVPDDAGSGAANTAAVATQIAANPGIGRIAAGSYYFDLMTNTTNSGYSALIYIPTGKGIVGDGPGVTNILYGGGSPTTVTDLVSNVTVAGGDTGMWVGNLTVDGRAADHATFNHGVVWRRATGHCRNVVSKDCRGAGAGSSTEMFHFDAWHGVNCTYKSCSAVATDPNTSSGFCSNFGNGIAWEDCEAYGMGRLMGFTTYKASNLRITRGYAHNNGAQGINFEYSDYCLVENSIADKNKGTGALSNRSSHSTWYGLTSTSNGTAGSAGKESGFEVIADATYPVTDVQVLNSVIGPGNVKGVTILSGGVTGPTNAAAQTLIGTDNTISGNTSANSNGGATVGTRTPISYTYLPIPDWPL